VTTENERPLFVPTMFTAQICLYLFLTLSTILAICGSGLRKAILDGATSRSVEVDSLRDLFDQNNLWINFVWSLLAGVSATMLPLEMPGTKYFAVWRFIRVSLGLCAMTLLSISLSSVSGVIGAGAGNILWNKNYLIKNGMNSSTADAFHILTTLAYVWPIAFSTFWCPSGNLYDSLFSSSRNTPETEARGSLNRSQSAIDGELQLGGRVRRSGPGTGTPNADASV